MIIKTKKNQNNNNKSKRNMLGTFNTSSNRTVEQSNVIGVKYHKRIFIDAKRLNANKSDIYRFLQVVFYN